MTAAMPAVRFDPRRPPSMEELEAALAKSPGDPDLLRRRAVLWLDRGNHAAATADLRQALQRSGANPPAVLLAVAARASLLAGHYRETEQLARRGLAQLPGGDDLHALLGAALQRQGKIDQALGAYEAAVNLNPFRQSYRVALAQALEAKGDRARAERVYRQALHSNGAWGDVALNLANLLQASERYDEADKLYRRSIELLGIKSSILSNLGALQRKMQRYGEAEATYRRASCLSPADSGVFYNYGNLLRSDQRLDEAISIYRRAIACRPDNAEIHWNLSLALLADGKLKDGFEEYEWRWKYDNFPSKRRDFPQPLWTGEPFEGRTLLLHTEQGVGDVLQFLRFVPMIVERKGRTGRIVLECHDTIMSLMRGFPGIDDMIERFSAPPPADLQLPLLSAPRVLGIDDMEKLPATVPYLPIPEGPDLPVPEVDPALLNVGFVFGGNPKFPNDRNRSTDLESWAPLFDVEGVRFFCLQKGEREPEVTAAPPSVVRLNERLESFRDTAVAMGKLDLVISTCTSVAHLAGALGKPVWVVLSRDPDWRWLAGRDDSPWYPSARLFRQTARGDWDGVFNRVRKALQEQVAAGRAHERGRA